VGFQPVRERRAGALRCRRSQRDHHASNDGRNLHGFQIVVMAASFIAGLNKSDLLVPGEVRKITVRLTQPGAITTSVRSPGTV